MKKRKNTLKIFESKSNLDYNFDNFNKKIKLHDSVETPELIVDVLDDKDAFEVIENILKHSPFDNFNKPNEKGKYKTLNSEEINQVFSYVVVNVKNKTKAPISKLKILFFLCDYFDIDEAKFFNSLVSTFKEELIGDLIKKYPELKAKLGKSLF